METIKEECQYCRWAREELNWNYCPECGLPSDPLKVFRKFSLLNETPTIATDNTLTTSEVSVEQTATAEEIHMWTPKSQEIAQWVIDNRYPKDELNKISDFELFNELAVKIDEYSQSERQRAIQDFLIIAESISFNSEDQAGNNCLVVDLEELKEKLKR